MSTWVPFTDHTINFIVNNLLEISPKWIPRLLIKIKKKIQYILHTRERELRFSHSSINVTNFSQTSPVDRVTDILIRGFNFIPTGGAVNNFNSGS